MSRSPPLELRVLGPLDARAGDREIALGGPRQRAVLAALLLRAGEVVSVERLADEVWGEDPPSSAGHTLEAYISKLRGILSPYGVSVERRGSGYRLDPGSAFLDSRAFERLLDESAALDAAGETEQSDGLVREALALWQSGVLADLPAGFDEAERRRLEELRLQALERRIDADLAKGRQQELVGELRMLVDANPYRERFVAQLMVALYRSGRSAEALDVYERTRLALRDDLGLDPSRELQQLSGQIVRQEPQLTLAPTYGVSEQRAASRRSVRVAVMLSALAAAALTALVVALISGAGSSLSTSPSPRVALVLPRPPTAGARTRTSLPSWTVSYAPSVSTT